MAENTNPNEENEQQGKPTVQPQRKPTRDPLDRDPEAPPRMLVDLLGGRVLDPSTAMKIRGVTPRATVYVSDRLLVPTAKLDAVLVLLNRVGEGKGWVIVEDEDFPAWEVTVPDPREPDGEITLGRTRLVIEVAEGTAASAPDAWILLQLARAVDREGAQGVGLDHAVFASGDPLPNPVHHDPNPVHHDPNPVHHDPNPVLDPSRVHHDPNPVRTDGRSPVSFIGPRPARHRDEDLTGLRPVVAILDSGCDTTHPWLQDVVNESVQMDGPIGRTDPATDAEEHGDLAGPLDGALDTNSGHGTFIAGLIHQACPDADILSWRLVDSEGPVAESDWERALAQVVKLVQAYRAGDPSGHRIDVLSLSMGYYHETSEDTQAVETARLLLGALGSMGVIVVCSAGNDGTARPQFPAALAPWRVEPDPPIALPVAADRLPLVSVGAQNPNKTDALFSNTGPWVRAWAPGVQLVSTLPTWNGGFLPVARVRYENRTREGFDPDDFATGFGTWTGTSFAAPLLAGRLAASLLRTMPSDEDEVRTTFAERGWAALEEHTELRLQAR